MRQIPRLCGLLVVSMAASQLLAANEVFHVRSLPKGKEVTLPRPATTLVPGSESVKVSSTDMPQSLKLSHSSGGQPFTIAIYDQQADHVKKIEMKPGGTYLYTFKDLGTISIVPEGTGTANLDMQTLRLESNKPLSISR